MSVLNNEKIKNEVLENAIDAYRSTLKVLKDAGEPLCIVTISLLEELKQYRDLEEQGLLLRLPCKVMDAVYVVNSLSKTVSLIAVASIVYDGHIYVKSGFGNIYKFGEDVFLTQSEAEEKLRELEGKYNGN